MQAFFLSATRKTAADRACTTHSHFEIQPQLRTLVNGGAQPWPTARFGVPLSKFEGGGHKRSFSNMTREKWLQPLWIAVRSFRNSLGTYVI